jgi:hypothetical protein
MGRFLTPDPSTGVQLGTPATCNKYAYVHGDPVNFYDPGGLNEMNPDGYCAAEYTYEDCYGEWPSGGGGGAGGGYNFVANQGGRYATSLCPVAIRMASMCSTQGANGGTVCIAPRPRRGSGANTWTPFSRQSRWSRSPGRWHSLQRRSTPRRGNSVARTPNQASIGENH